MRDRGRENRGGKIEEWKDRESKGGPIEGRLERRRDGGAGERERVIEGGMKGEGGERQ